eukprot:Pgem_evm2s19861
MAENPIDDSNDSLLDEDLKIFRERRSRRTGSQSQCNLQRVEVKMMRKNKFLVSGESEDAQQQIFEPDQQLARYFLDINRQSSYNNHSIYTEIIHDVIQFSLEEE